MKAAIFESFGEPTNVLTMKEVPKPKPNQGEILVRMKRSPIHNHDILTVRGEYGNLPQLPAIGGTEAVGIVEAVGDDVSLIKEGMRVSVSGVENTWAEYFIAPATAAVPIPDNISDEAAAQLMSMPASSLMALNKIPAKAGDWIVINAANGAVGKSIAQLARARGINVASIVTRVAAKTELESLNIHPVFVAQKKDWIEEAKKQIDGPVVGGIEMVGGTASRDLISLVGQNATVLAFGAMSNQPMLLDTGDLIYKEITIKGFWGLRESQRATPDEMAKIVAELINLVEQGMLHLPVHNTYDLSKIANAGADYYKPRNGKLMIAA